MARARRQRANAFPVDVLGSGAVLLGPSVSADGFQLDHGVRVQTHLHSDHMNDFTTSLRGTVVMTDATKRLLEHDHPALSSRTNVVALQYGKEWADKGCRIQLFSSQHALGAAQVKVTLKSGQTLGYSGDFDWPLEAPIKVDALVVDATYGDPDSRPTCPQTKVQEALVDLVRKHLRRGPVHLMADTGPAERALVTLAVADVLHDVPIVASSRACHYAEVHRDFGQPMPQLVCDESREARAALGDGRGKGKYVRLWSLNSRWPNDGLYEGAVIRLTKYRATTEPFEKVPGRDVFTVGFSNHADFRGTVEYVSATGASFVVTDNLRGNRDDRGEKLAKMLRAQLGIQAKTSSNNIDHRWGR
jgi:putative mRNA 3-end processing factor